MRYTCLLCVRSTVVSGGDRCMNRGHPRRRKTRARDRDEERDRESTRDERKRPCYLRLEDPGAVSRARARRTRRRASSVSPSRVPSASRRADTAVVAPCARAPSIVSPRTFVHGAIESTDEYFRPRRGVARAHRFGHRAAGFGDGGAQGDGGRGLGRTYGRERGRRRVRG